ncbi:cyclic nucleotide-binding domain-containing protein [Echinicola rosea]|uniref:Cyclic nucleotide-binding domain-containing protein n=1 Tax=Echinicola rosea TaxID=1807691 RepID=A0ABQ1UPU2_9BACT|nr:cyclic nucleotide-binding domain-containing protein [Echinicola rosea]GGF24176.1 hypothetical protein GCM10011339_10330 [Echinicola rosea]
MKKLTDLEKLKKMLDNFYKVDMEHYESIEHRIKFFTYRKKDVIRKKGREENEVCFVMEGLVGITLNDRLRRVYPPQYFAMDMASFEKQMDSNHEVVALQPCRVACCSRDNLEMILPHVNGFKILYDRVVGHTDNWEGFWTDIDGLSYKIAWPMVKEKLQAEMGNLTQKQLAQLLNISVRTMARIMTEPEGKKASRTAMVFCKGFPLRTHPKGNVIKGSLDAWRTYFFVALSNITAKTLSEMKMEFLVGRLYPLGNEDLVAWAGRLISLLTAIDVFMYQIPVRERSKYWKEIRTWMDPGLQAQTKGDVPLRGQAYASAIKDLFDEISMDAERADFLLALIGTHVVERDWQFSNYPITTEPELRSYERQRQRFSEGKLCMQLLKIVYHGIWQELKADAGFLETYMEMGTRLVLLSNEILAVDTVVFEDLPHNLVYLKSRVEGKDRKKVVRELVKGYMEEKERMYAYKKQFLSAKRKETDGNLLEFISLVEGQVAGWETWYRKVLTTINKTN